MGMKVFVTAVLCLILATMQYWLVIPRLKVTFIDEVQKPVIIAHRGGAFYAPENSKAAILYASQRKNVWAVELDLSFTKDNVPVVFHDFTLDRTTNVSGLLGDFTFNDLKYMDIGKGHPMRDQFPIQNLMKFEDAVKLCIELEMRMFLDIKTSDERTIKFVSGLFNKYPLLYDRAIVISFFPKFLYFLRLRDERIVTGFLYRPNIAYQDIEATKPWFESPIMHNIMIAADPIHRFLYHHFYYWVIGVSAILPHYTMVDAAYLRYWSDRKLPVITWCPNDEGKKKYFINELRISIITDSP